MIHSNRPSQNTGYAPFHLGQFQGRRSFLDQLQTLQAQARFTLLFRPLWLKGMK